MRVHNRFHKTAIDAERDDFVREMMKSAGIPGVQTVVVKNNRIVWQKSYGQAVLAQPGPARPMRDDSILYTASIGKMLTAIAVMQQVEKGRLSLDDDINAYVPFVVRNPKWPDVPITWRMLLTHTSSINDAEDVQEALYVYGAASPITFEEYVEDTFKPGGLYNRPDSYLAGKPGTERIYSSNGLDLAGYAIARLVHQPFTTYVNQAILTPLGIKESSYSLADLPASKLAVGYGRTLVPRRRLDLRTQSGRIRTQFRLGEPSWTSRWGCRTRGREACTPAPSNSLDW